MIESCRIHDDSNRFDLPQQARPITDWMTLYRTIRVPVDAEVPPVRCDTENSSRRRTAEFRYCEAVSTENFCRDIVLNVENISPSDRDTK